MLFQSVGIVGTVLASMCDFFFVRFGKQTVCGGKRVPFEDSELQVIARNSLGDQKRHCLSHGGVLVGRENHEAAGGFPYGLENLPQTIS
jgi:hypothetical protein